MIRLKGRALAAMATLGMIAAACGGAAPAQSSPTAPAATKATQAAATTAPTAKPATCFPVSGKCAEEAQALNGSGATFPAVIYTKWISEYEKVTGVKVNYQGIGSGGGIKGITDRTVDFAGSDAPMTEKQLEAAKDPLFHVPTVMGGVVATYNIPGVTNLKFSADLIAGIFLGEITKWNDPKIAAENAGVSLPDQPITVVHRSDGSGTTSIFTDYLSKVSATWKSKVGSGTSVNWPTGIGGKGNEGVANNVKQKPYSIGYVELIYAVQQKLPAPPVKNAKGKYVEASLDSVTAAAQGITLPNDLRASITNSDNPDAYPIAGFTWLLTYENMQDKQKALALTRFLWWATHDGQKFAKELGYAPLPGDVVKRAEEMIRSMKVGGTPILPKG